MRDGSIVARSITTTSGTRKTRAKDNMQGLVLTIHLVAGTANGLQTAEIDNWIGKVFVAPRTDLPSMLQQPDLKGLGVYVLIGDDPNQINRSIVYIGQGHIATRLAQHSSDNAKEFWGNKTLAVVAKDNSLNTADCLYLESRLIELASNAKTATLTNGQYPSLPNMTATDKTRVENFLAQIQVLLPVLNINFFVPPPKLSVLPRQTIQSNSVIQGFQNHSVPVSAQSESPEFVLVTGTVSAEAEIVNSKFVVRQGATVSPNQKPALGSSTSSLINQLRADGRLVDNPATGKWTFSQDVEFSSPSAAAAVICGYQVNGRTYWKVKNTGETYNDWDVARVNAVLPVMP